MAYEPDTTWVRELVARKQAGLVEAPPPLAAEPASPWALSRLRADLWRELRVAVAAYNEAMDREVIEATFASAGNGVSLVTRDYPSGQFDLDLDPETCRYIATVKLRKDEAGPLIGHGFEGRWIDQGDLVFFVWFGAVLSPPEFVRRILTPFFDEI